MNKRELRLSPLAHTWIFDLDGTLVEHNGYLNGGDKWLPGALEFLKNIPEQDYILILTARFEEWAIPKTKAFLEKYNVRYNQIIFNVPLGERILFNDDKPSGLQGAHSVSLKRDQGLSFLSLNIDKNL